MTNDLAALSDAAHWGNFQRRKFLEALEAEYRAGRLVHIDREGMRENIADVYTKGWQHAKAGKGSFRDATVDAAIAAILGDAA